MATLAAQPLDAVAFRPYGQVVVADGPSRPANDGRAQRFSRLAELSFGRSGLRPELAVYRLQPSALPFGVDYLERHPLTSQVFVPTSGGEYLVVVAGNLPGGAIDESTLRAFVAGPGQGICYAPGVWHCPLATLRMPADFLMFMWEADAADDCEVQQLSRRYEVVLPS